MKTGSAIGDFCDNPFQGRLLMYPNHSLGIGIINSIMIPVTLSTNTLLIFSLLKTDQLQSVSNYFILLLTVSDCAMGLVGQTLVSLLFTKYKRTSICKIETTTTCLTTFFGYLSGFSILSISIDRCIHMIFLHRYSQIVTKRRVLITIMGCVILACMTSFSYLMGTFYKKYHIVKGVILLMDMTVILVIYTVYMSTYLRIKRHVDETAHLRQPGPRTPALKDEAGHENKKKPKYSFVLTKTIFVVLGAAFISYVPYVTVSMIKVVRVTSSSEPTSPYLQLALYVTYLLTYLNSALNAIIFLHGNKKCRVFVLQKTMQLSISPVTLPPLGQTPRP